MSILKKLVLGVLLCVSHLGFSQEEVKEQSMLRDSLDNKLDASDFLMEANGFIPLPQLITEPALGGIGGVLAAVFIKPNKVQIEGQYVPPNITAGFGAYTANKTWGIGVLRIASLPKYGIKYRTGMVYANANMNFYRTMPRLGEVKFGFNFEMTPVFISVLKEIAKTNLYLGAQYLYINMKVKPDFEFENFPDFDEKLTSQHNLSSAGIVLEYDLRDNIFTPNKGMIISSNYRINANWTGSDYSYEQLTAGILQFFQFNPKWVGGFRFDTKFMFGDAPFYAYPSISMRGVPLRRYQGTEIYTVEIEQRYDFSKRWSGLVFGGLSKAPTDQTSFSDALLVHNYGTGFRYLLARKFGLRMGVDVAWSNNDFGYYITFGSAWNNRN